MALPYITGVKMSLLFMLGYATVAATDLSGESGIEKYTSLGVGGLLAATIFYFYRQQANQLAKRERENADTYRIQNALLISTVQETSRVNTGLMTAVSELRAQLGELAHDQRERYENDLRDGGRRRYDPKLSGN